MLRRIFMQLALKAPELQPFQANIERRGSFVWFNADLSKTVFKTANGFLQLWFRPLFSTLCLNCNFA